MSPSVATKEYDLSVVIACYQEEGHLRQSIQELCATLDELGRSYELVFVEDKSRDRTAALVREITAGKPNMRAVYHAENVGRGGTATRGWVRGFTSTMA